MDLSIIAVPYDSARRGERMGAGPLALLDAGLERRLAAQGHDVRVIVLEAPAGSWRAEIRTAFELAGLVAVAVREARAAGRFPLVLAGNCGVSLGIVGALGSDARVVWCDAHGDFNTPETTTGGFLDGMGLATLVGRCWSALARGVLGSAPLLEEHVWLVGARDLDPEEAELLRASRVRQVPAAAVDDALAARIADEAGGAPVYLHLDLDVMDPRDGRVNSYAVPDGVPLPKLTEFAGTLAARGPLAAMTLSAYDPAADADGRARASALTLLDAIASRL